MLGLWGTLAVVFLGMGLASAAINDLRPWMGARQRAERASRQRLPQWLTDNAFVLSCSLLFASFFCTVRWLFQGW